MKRTFLAKVTVICIIILLFGTFVYANYQISIIIDGKEVESDVAPQLISNRTLVPIRVITESFGGDVNWIQETMTVEISSPYEIFVDNLSEDKSYIKSADEALSMLENDIVLILDVRSDDSRSRSLINDSIHIPISELLDRIHELPEATEIVIYSDKDINAAFAVSILNMNGFESHVLEGGINAWITAGGKCTFFST